MLSLNSTESAGLEQSVTLDMLINADAGKLGLKGRGV